MPPRVKIYKKQQKIRGNQDISLVHLFLEEEDLRLKLFNLEGDIQMFYLDFRNIYFHTAFVSFKVDVASKYVKVSY
jgi:hypothetical protein